MLWFRGNPASASERSLDGGGFRDGVFGVPVPMLAQ